MLLLASLNACQSDDPSNEGDNGLIAKERQDIPLTRSEAALVGYTTNFSLGLFSQVCQQTQGKNVLVSPLGAAALLNLMANGGDGNTADEIYAALSPDGYDAGELNSFYAKLNTWLPELDNTTTVTQAYSLWMDNRFSIKDSYVDFAKSVMDADIIQADFKNPQSQQALYQWCSEHTNGRIKEIGCSLPDAQLVLLNALYFKGTWANKFELSQTQKDTFYGSSRISVVQMMHNKQMAGYAANEHFTAVHLPYGNGAYFMMLVLPAENTGMMQAAQTLNHSAWNDLSARIAGRKIDLKLPKFELEGEMSLVEVLRAMGIEDAFCNEADFSKITDASVFFNVFSQKSLISVDEKGTEASSVTWAGMDTSAGEGNTEVLPIIFNRPFFFLIQEKSTGVILFMGKIENMEES